MAKGGALKPIIARTFPLDQVVEAHRYIESQPINRQDRRDSLAHALLRSFAGTCSMGRRGCPLDESRQKFDDDPEE
jgi:Zinc-binding dehydrogenase